ALSRGAGEAWGVDARPAALAAARANGELLEARGLHLIRAEQPAQGDRLAAAGSFDFIFADPPYGLPWDRALFDLVAAVLAEDGEFSLETGPDTVAAELPTPWVQVDVRRYGSSVLRRFRRPTSRSPAPWRG